MIFPEGGRSLDGTVLPLQAGAFRLAVALEVPVLPVTIAGGRARHGHPGKRYPRPGRIVDHLPSALGSHGARARARRASGLAQPAPTTRRRAGDPRPRRRA